MSLPQRKTYTPEQYLELERNAATKSDYFNGEIFAMTGASRKHNLITVNIASSLNGQLKGGQCEVYANDMRIKVTAGGLYTYPDVVVACGSPEFEDEHIDTLLNPILIIEVLSKSTEGDDRGEKCGYYRTLESLSEYLLVRQDKPHVEHYVRQPGGLWLLSEADGLQARIDLHSINCQLAMADIYDKFELGV
jgi:Uma2 family endonuclease